MNKRTQAAYAWFREKSGYVGTGAAGNALKLAKAEEWARENVTFSWEWEDQPDLSWCECSNGSVEHEHEVIGCIAKGPDGFEASLWQITDADRDYRRVIEAELASEVKYQVEGTREMYGRHFAE